MSCIPSKNFFGRTTSENTVCLSNWVIPPEIILDTPTINVLRKLTVKRMSPTNTTMYPFPRFVAYRKKVSKKLEWNELNSKCVEALVLAIMSTNPKARKQKYGNKKERLPLKISFTTTGDYTTKFVINFVV